MVLIEERDNRLVIIETGMDAYNRVGIPYYCKEGYSLVESNSNFFVGNISLSAVVNTFNQIPSIITIYNEKELIEFIQRYKDCYLVLYSIKEKLYANNNNQLIVSYTEINYNVINCATNSNELLTYVRKKTIDEILHNL